MKKYELKINDRQYEVVIKNVTPRNVQVEVNGREHVVEIEAIRNLPVFRPPTGEESPVAVPTPSTRRPKPSPAGAAPLGGIIAPMPGQIKSIFVREGDYVKKGHLLLIMEAMKLENKITARKDGLVKKILVRDGDTVNQGQELVVIE